MPSVATNTKYRCGGCGAIADLGDEPRACACGSKEWHQITVEHCCDFCSAPGARWSFPCQDFDDNEGPWAACDECKDLMVAGRRLPLWRRAVEHELRMNPGQTGVLRAVKTAHDGFFAHRIGDEGDEPHLDEEVTDVPHRFGVGPLDTYSWSVMLEWTGDQTHRIIGKAPDADLALGAAMRSLGEDAPVIPPDRVVVQLLHTS